MLISTLPFDYTVLLDPSDRVRKARSLRRDVGRARPEKLVKRDGWPS